jgi:hypothetical protein
VATRPGLGGTTRRADILIPFHVLGLASSYCSFALELLTFEKDVLKSGRRRTPSGRGNSPGLLRLALVGGVQITATHLGEAEEESNAHNS